MNFVWRIEGLLKWKPDVSGFGPNFWSTYPKNESRKGYDFIRHLGNCQQTDSECFFLTRAQFFFSTKIFFLLKMNVLPSSLVLQLVLPICTLLPACLCDDDQSWTAEISDDLRGSGEEIWQGLDASATRGGRSSASSKADIPTGTMQYNTKQSLWFSCH